MTNEQKTRLFSEMLPSEIKKWENESNAIVMFGVGERGIAFNKSVANEDNSEALVILIDGIEHPVIIVQPEITRLKNYLRNNFVV